MENMGEEIVPINMREEFESNSLGEINIGRALREPIFIYDKETGEKITDWTYMEKIIELCKEENVPYFILGNGSNLLVGDKGFRGVVIQLYKNFDELQKELIILANAGVIDIKFYDKIAAEINKSPEQKQQTIAQVEFRKNLRQNQKQ